MSEIKTNFELPRGDDDKKYTQRVAQDLSKNFKAILKSNNEIKSQIADFQSSQFMKKFVDLTFSFTASSPTYQVITLAHNLGVIPTGWIIIDIYRVGGSSIAPGVMRISWDATNITLENYVFMQYVAKVRVFI